MTAVPHYGAYIAGSDSPEALGAKRTYVAQRRAAGLESMSGYREPEVKKVGDSAAMILLRPTQVKIMDALAFDGANTEVIARRTEVSAETVRRHLRVICKALGYTDRAELLSAVSRGKVYYRATGR